MRFKILIGIALVLAAYSFSPAERYARYNYIGYFPKSLKRIVIMSDDDCAGTKWEIKDQSKKSVLSGTVPKSIFQKGDHTPLPFNYEIVFDSITTEGTYTFEMQGIKDVQLNIKKDLLRPVIASNLRWFYVQRSGSKECLDHEPAHFGDSSSIIFHRKGTENTDPWEADAKKKKANMLGGWYDGYVYTKYTASIAYATYYLLRAYELKPNLFDKKYSKTDLVDVLDNAKFGLDYLLKVMPDDNEFIIQVGGWEDNERGMHLPHLDPLNGKRECYSIISPTQMGFAAAALALGSATFKQLGKTEDAKKYEQMAVKIFKKASTTTNPPAWLEKEYDVYKDETKDDNLQLAASELYRLTKDKNYLAKAQKYANAAKSAGWVYWNEQNMSAHQRIMEDYPNAKKFLTEDLSTFLKSSTSNGNIWSLPIEYTMAGLSAYIECASGVFSYQLAANDKKYEVMGQHILDYVLGCNNWGVCFVSLKAVKQSVKNFYSQIYRLQSSLFPEGNIPNGPLDVETHDAEAKWCCFDVTIEPTYPFNTSKVKFFDHSDDYTCMDSPLYGVADGLFLFTLATKIYGE